MCHTAPALPHTAILDVRSKLVVKVPSLLLDLVLGLTSAFVLSDAAVQRWPIQEPVRFYGVSLQAWGWGRSIQSPVRFSCVLVQAWDLISAFLEAYFQA